jgi:hypothetical protein
MNSMPKRLMPVWSQLLSREEIHVAGRTGWTHMEAAIILRDEGAVNGIQRALATLALQKILQTAKRIRMVDGAGAHIGIRIEA